MNQTLTYTNTINSINTAIKHLQEDNTKLREEMKQMAARHQEAHQNFVKETAAKHLEAQEKMSFYIDGVTSIQMETTYMTAHTELATQTGVVMEGINKLGAMMSALLGGKMKWTDMEIPDPNVIPQESLDTLHAAKEEMRTIPVPFHDTFPTTLS